MTFHVSTKSADYWAFDTLGEINLYQQSQCRYYSVRYPEVAIFEARTFWITVKFVEYTILNDKMFI